MIVLIWFLILGLGLACPNIGTGDPGQMFSIGFTFTLSALIGTVDVIFHLTHSKVRYMCSLSTVKLDLEVGMAILLGCALP